MKNESKEAFEKYYEDLCKVYLENFNSKPTISYDGKDTEIDSEMIISKPNDDGESAWQLKSIGDYDFSKVEEIIGFKMCDELKSYYSTYLFLHLAGEYKEITLYFDMLKSKELIEKSILVAQKDGAYYFQDTEVFSLGSAVFNDDDAYGIFYNNKTGSVFVYENDTDNKIELDDSLFEIIKNMKALF
ncbi:MAG: SecY-interacting protein Syd [Clostridia bacterium]|nr:SecY-interacting protein Syd [Clostridia bacterium]